MCFKCNEPIPLHVSSISNILTITADASADVDFKLRCKSCRTCTYHPLPCKSDLVQKFLRNFITPNSDVCLETINCCKCKKPCNMDFSSIKKLDNNDEKVHVFFPCNLCKRKEGTRLPYKIEPIQKFLQKLCLT